MGQAALARRAKHSKRSYVGDICGFGLRRAFPAEILNFLRRGAYQALLIRTSRAALRAFPQAEASLLRIDFLPDSTQKLSRKGGRVTSCKCAQ